MAGLLWLPLDAALGEKECFSPGATVTGELFCGDFSRKGELLLFPPVYSTPRVISNIVFLAQDWKGLMKFSLWCLNQQSLEFL